MLINWGAHQLQKRAHEDRFVCDEVGKFKFFAIFDGHGGAMKMSDTHVADYCVKNLHKLLALNLGKIDITDNSLLKQTIIDTFIELDRSMHEKKLLYGCTCTAVLIDSERIILINLGDSRTLLCDENKILFASKDHTPSDLDEMKRIYDAKGFVYWGRVCGILMLSRAFGDFDSKAYIDEKYNPIKGMISAVPDVKIFNIQEEKITDILMMSDAPFEANKYNNELLFRLMKIMRKQFERAGQIAQALTELINKTTTDDTTFIHVMLSKSE